MNFEFSTSSSNTMKSSIFFTLESATSEFSLNEVRDSARNIPGIERVIALPDDGPDHLHMAVCSEGADLDLLLLRLGDLPHMVSMQRGRIN